MNSTPDTPSDLAAQPDDVAAAVKLKTTAEFMRETANMLRKIERENPLHDPGRFAILNEADCLDIFARTLEQDAAMGQNNEGTT